LDETYERVLRDIHEDNKEHARRLLHCLAVAIRPLFVEELAEILAFDFDVPEGGIPELHTDWRWKDQEQAVLSTCTSLITIAEYGHSSSRRVVQFSHFSVKEFLMSNRLSSPIRDVSQYHILPEPAHTILAQACLGFLLHLDDHIDTQKVEDFPLAEYAAAYWVVHAQFQDVAVHVKCGMKNLFDPDRPHFASWRRIHDIDGPPYLGYDEVTRATTPLYYSALAGCYDLTRHLAIEHPQDVNAIGGVFDFPLVAALSRRHTRVAELLLEHGGKVNIQGTRGRAPLHTLLLRNYFEEDRDNCTVQLLLERGADLNARDEGYQTPLHTLLELHNFTWGFDSHRADYILVVSRLLLEHGADVNARDSNHRTPLFLAMQHETSNLARFLLENGADPDLKNKAGKAPLHILLGIQDSSWDGRYHSTVHILVVAQLLLEDGADVNTRDNIHNTPLFLAMRHEASNLVRFLLEHGANPNLQNKEGKTPLHKLFGPQDSGWAPHYHSADYISIVAQLLLEHGADVNSRDNDHNTPLLLARRQGTSNVERFLLEHGADLSLGSVTDR
jgi:ankyrin repeat protein